MHEEILTKDQIKQFPLLKRMSGEFGLAGGTAAALHIGHRRSIDFDLFSNKTFNNALLKEKVRRFTKIDKILTDQAGEFTFLTGKVKITFLHYPFNIKYENNLNTVIKMPSLITLAAMKAQALGRRAKWKDYVDLFLIIKKYHSLHAIIKKAEKIFSNEFNSKIFRTQLAYFEDINYEEKVDFLPGFEINEAKIKKELINFSLER